METYEPEDLDTSVKDQVRFLLGDTGPNVWQYQDEEIVASVDLFGSGSAVKTASVLAHQLAAKAATSHATSYSIGDLSVSQADAAEHWAKLAAYLEGLWAKGLGMASALRGPGGIAWEELPPIFAITQHDTPGSSGTIWSPHAEGWATRDR